MPSLTRRLGGAPWQVLLKCTQCAEGHCVFLVSDRAASGLVPTLYLLGSLAKPQSPTLRNVVESSPSTKGGSVA